MSGIFDLWLQRRFMAQPGGDEPYITDGLVFRIDGKKRGNTPGTVTDLIGGMQFINNGVTFAADGGMVFNGSVCFSTDADNVLPANSDYTIEIVFKPGASGTQYMFGTGDNDHGDRPMVVLENNRIHLASSRSTTGRLCFEMTSVIGSPFIVSGNHTTGVINGDEVPISSYGDYWVSGATNKTIVGARYTNVASYRTYFTGTIYAIRIYYRRLTAAEMMQNQIVDNERFNLGLTIQTS